MASLVPTHGKGLLAHTLQAEPLSLHGGEVSQALSPSFAQLRVRCLWWMLVSMRGKLWGGGSGQPLWGKKTTTTNQNRPIWKFKEKKNLFGKNNLRASQTHHPQWTASFGQTKSPRCFGVPLAISQWSEVRGVVSAQSFRGKGPQ